jgi:diguanylate cyclase (GGDEF)-like protein
MLERTPRERELLQTLSLLVAARWGVVVLMGLLSVAISVLVRGRIPALSIVGLILLIGIYNAGLEIYLGRLRREPVLRLGERGLRRLATLQMVLDLSAVAAVMGLTGGIGSPYGPALLFLTLVGSLLLTPRQGFFLATLAVGYCGLLAYLEYQGLILHKGYLTLPHLSREGAEVEEIWAGVAVGIGLFAAVLAGGHVVRRSRAGGGDPREALILGEMSQIVVRLSGAGLSPSRREPVFQAVAEKAARMTSADMAAVLILDETDGAWAIGGSHGLRVPLSSDAGMQAALSRLPPVAAGGIMEDLTRADSVGEPGGTLELHRSWGVRAGMVVPLVGGGRILGALHICYGRPHRFRTEEIETAQAIASSLSLALRSAELLRVQERTREELEGTQARLQAAVRDREQKNAELRALQDLSLALQSTLRLDEILRIAVRGCRESLGFGLVLLSLVDSERGVLERVAGAGMPESELERLRSESPPLAYLGSLMRPQFQRSRSFFISSREATGIVDDRYTYTDRSREMVAPGPESWHPEDILITPLNSKKGELIGLLSVDKPVDGRIPSPERILSLEVFAGAAGLAIENARIYEQAERTIKDLGTVHEVSTAISSVLRLDVLLKRVVQIIQEKLGYVRVSILLREGGTEELVLRASHGLLTAQDRTRLKPGEGLVGWVAATGETALVPDVRSDSRYVGDRETVRSEIAIPVKRERHVIGVLEVAQQGGGSLDQRDVQVLSSLATQIAVVIENARLYEETERLALTDEMTGIHNYRRLQSRLSDEFRRANRYHRPLSLIMLDIDAFKQYNDTHGHMKGDIILRELAQLLARVTRDVDFIARYGGEEFMIVLPETGKDEATRMAERIHREVRNHGFHLAETQPLGRLTVSLGVATHPEDTMDRDELVEFADRAMYQAKREGRDRVCPWSEACRAVDPPVDPGEAIPGDGGLAGGTDEAVA